MRYFGGYKQIFVGHQKENIQCITASKDGKRYATGGADKSVIIWKKDFTPEKRYSHTDAVQCLAFNPLTNKLFSGGVSDYILCSTDSNQIEKFKNNSRVLCCSWSSDGLYLAFGQFDGKVLVKDKNLEEKFEIELKQPVWCLDWSPLSPEYTEHLLAVGCWNKTLSFWDLESKQIFTAKNIDFNPLSIQWFTNGEFFSCTGSNKLAQLYTREGNFIITYCEGKDWMWCGRVKPKSMILATTSNDGFIQMHQINQLVVHALYKDTYVSRDSIVDVVVQNILLDQKLRIKCKELVKKVSIYKDRLAVQLNEKILIYVSNNDQSELRYKLFKKIKKQVECSLLVVTSFHILLCNDKMLKMINFSGVLEREWNLDSSIRYLKVLGGPPKRESLLIGLKNGHVLKVFLENPFPIVLIKQNVAVRCVDLSANKKKLAIVDENSNLSVYDLVTKEMIFSEMNVTSVAYNTELDDLLAYSGNGMLFIKISNLPTSAQKSNGFVVGQFKGSKLFILHKLQMQTIDVPQTASMIKYIEKKDFDMAYQLASLGSTDQDFKYLGIEAIGNGNFNVARKCFLRIESLAYLDLISKFEKDQKNGIFNLIFVQAELAAYQGKFQDAGNILIKNGFGDKAVELFTDLKNWDEAKKFAKLAEQNSQKNPNIEGQKNHLSRLLKDQAEWMKETGDWKTAAELFIASKDFKRAIEIYGSRGEMQCLSELCRTLDKSDGVEQIQQCALLFRKNKQHGMAKEAYLKLGDLKSLVALHVEFDKWEEAFMIARQNPEYMEIIKLPYANYLCKNDRYEDALKVYKKLGRIDLSNQILAQLTENATSEARFKDTAYLNWILALQNLSFVKNGFHPDKNDTALLNKFNELSDISSMYYAYDIIHNFIDSPFGSNSEISVCMKVFNAARFLACKIQSKPPIGISQVYIYYALAKVARVLEGFKIARYCYDKLSTLNVPSEWIEELDLNNLLVRSKPFSDSDNLLAICNRCMSQNQIISPDNRCYNCYHPFQQSFISFEILPLVEFRVDSSKISHQRVLELLQQDTQQTSTGIKRKQEDDGWTESQFENQQSLNMNRSEDMTLFDLKLNEICEIQMTSKEYQPLYLDENIIKSLNQNEVYWIDYSKYCPTLPIRYFKNLVPDIPLETCPECYKFFILDEYEIEFFKNKKCPFCRVIDQRVAKPFDNFD